MSVGIVRVQKFSKGSVKGVEIHDQREKEGISHTNPDIDWGRSCENYDLCPAQNRNYYRAVQERIEQLHLPRAVRKDAVVMAQVLVTSDHDFFDGLTPEQTQQFFRDAYSFLANRYGPENIVSAMVHMDEQTPHMHLNFVPITSDGKLSAKRLLTRPALIEQQTAFQNAVGIHYGLQRGRTREERIEQGAERKHFETQEYKEYIGQLKSLQREVEETRGEVVQLRQEAAQAEMDLQWCQESLQATKNKLAVETAMITGMGASEPVKAIKERKGHFGAEDTVEISKKDFEKAQQAISALPGAYKALQRARNLSDVEKHEEEKNVLQGQIEALQKQLRDSDAKLMSMSWNLKDTSDRYDAFVTRVNQTFERLERRLRIEFPDATQEEVHEFLMAVIEEREPKQRNDMEMGL